MELREALDRLVTIQDQLAATVEWRCLRALPVALSAAMAVSTAAIQELWIEDPLAAQQTYLTLWLACAVCSGGFAAATAWRQTLRSSSALDHAHLRLAARLFLPAVVVGGICTVVIATRESDLLWLLPALWQLLFGLGNLAAQQLLPANVRWLGLWFLCTGTTCLWLREAALQPWAMGIPFAAGQALLAWSLWRQSQRHSDHHANDNRATDWQTEAQR